MTLCFILQQGIPDDSDEFGEFRLRVADLIKDCVFIVGSGNCFSQVRKVRERGTSNALYDHEIHLLERQGARAKEKAHNCVLGHSTIFCCCGDYNQRLS